MQTRRNVSTPTRRDQPVADREADQHAGRDPRQDAGALAREQAEVRVREQRAHRLDRAHDRERDLEVVLREALVVPEQRERRARDRRQAVEQADAGAERHRGARCSLRIGQRRPDAWSRISGSSTKYATELDVRRRDVAEQQRADDHAGHEADRERQHAAAARGARRARFHHSA